MTCRQAFLKPYVLNLVFVLCILPWTSFGYDTVGNRYGIDTGTLPYIAPQNPFYCSNGQCDQSTVFAWGRAMDRLGIQLSPRGTACSWWTGYDRHFSRHSEPRANSLAVWWGPTGNACSGGNPGHVAYVEEVDGDYVYINEAAPGGASAFDGNTKRFTRNELLTRNGYVLKGYLHLDSPYSYYYDWDFSDLGTADWTARDASSQGVYSDGSEHYWRLGSSFGDNTLPRQIYSPVLNTIHTDEFNTLEITFSEANTVVGSISVSASFKVNGTWSAPVALPRVSGPGTTGSVNTYRCSVPASPSGPLQQVAIRFDAGSSLIDKSISISAIAFGYIDNVPSSEFYTLSGYITDPNTSAVEWLVRARETSGANLGNTATTGNHIYRMALFPGNYDIYCESHTYVGGSVFTRTSIVQNVDIVPDPVYPDTVLNLEILPLPFDPGSLDHLSGHVRNSSGAGIPSVTVSATSYDHICSSSGVTDADGFFDIPVIPGTYDVLFSAPGGTLYVNRSIIGLVLTGDTVLGDTILDSIVQYILNGYFIDGSGVHTLSGYDHADVNADNLSIDHSAWTSTSDGSFFFNLFVTGSYCVSADLTTEYNRGNSGTITRSTYQIFDYLLRPAHLEIPLPSFDYYFLDGIVTDMKGIPLSGVRIDALEVDGRCNGWSYSDSEGYYSLRLIPGHYTLTVASPDPASYAPLQVNNMTIWDDCQRNIRLSRDYSLLDEALGQLGDELEIALDVLDIINKRDSLTYAIRVEGTKSVLELIPDWDGTGVSLALYSPTGELYGTYTSPATITIANPSSGIWTCVMSANDSLPARNTPVALAAGLTMNAGPVAEASGPYSGYVNSPITFNAGTSSDTDGTIVLYEWDWNNDGVFDQSSPSPTISHTWTSAYSGTVALRVTDERGADATDICTVSAATPSIPVTPVTYYTLSASAAGGNGTVSPRTGSYPANSVVTLTASPFSGYRVKAWHGTNNDASTSSSNAVTMNSDRTVTVEFELIPGDTTPPATTYSLSGSVVGGHGSLSITPSNGPYVQGTLVSLSAAPDSGYRVKAWRGTDDDSSLSSSNRVTMNSDHSVTVEFEPIQATPDTGGGGGGGGGGCFLSASRGVPTPLSGELFLACVVMLAVHLGSSKGAGKTRC